MSKEETVKDRVEVELEALRAARGVLLAADVVDFARANPESALHSRFTWDDSVAAEKFRLQQARDVIRCYVTLVATGSEEVQRVRVWHHLSTDKAGYRPLVEVRGDPEMRATMVMDCMRELQRLRQKYKSLTALSEIWEALEKAEQQQKQGAEVSATG